MKITYKSHMINAINTSAGRIEIITPDQLKEIMSFDIGLSNQNIHINQMVGTPGIVWSGSIPTTPITHLYKRVIIKTEPYDNLTHHIVKTFCDQMTTDVLSYDKDFFEAINDGVVEVLQDFGMPTHCVVFNSNTFLVGDFESSHIKFKESSPNEGTTIVYSPNKFRIVTISKIIPQEYHHHTHKFDKYLTRPLLISTLNKLELK